MKKRPLVTAGASGNLGPDGFKTVAAQSVLNAYHGALVQARARPKAGRPTRAGDRLSPKGIGKGSRRPSQRSERKALAPL